MTVSRKESFNNTEAQLAPNPTFPAISEDVQQTLARLMGLDPNNSIFRFLRTDQDGRLLVSATSLQGTSAQQPNVTVTTASINLLAANSSRRVFIIQNLGASAIYLGFGITALTTHLQVPANGGVFIDDHFLGAINAIAASGSNDVRIAEF